MIGHIAVADVHFHLACHTFGAQGSNRKAGGHTEEENASLWAGEQNGCKFAVGDIDDIDSEISLAVATSTCCAYLFNKFKWTRRVTLHDYIGDSQVDDILRRLLVIFYGNNLAS